MLHDRIVSRYISVSVTALAGGTYGGEIIQSNVLNKWDVITLTGSVVIMQNVFAS
jgi:hypothetical protein